MYLISFTLIYIILQKLNFKLYLVFYSKMLSVSNNDHDYT